MKSIRARGSTISERRPALQRLANTPLYPWLFAAYPAVQLAAHNVFQVNLQELLRPLLFSWLLASIGYLVLRLIFRRSALAAFALIAALLFFFTYGHAYQYLRAHPIGEVNLGRHRYLLIGYGLLLTAAFLAARRARASLAHANPWLNGLTALLLLLPTLQIASHLAEAARANRDAAAALAEDAESFAAANAKLPDVYYIVLDTYTRSDALQRDYGFDNSWFVQGLEAYGFYVAECSRSNYGETLSSLTSALNLNYLPQVHGRLAEVGLDDGSVFALLKHSLVRSQLESIGYQTVAFQTGFDWSDMREADIYLSLSEQPLDLQRMSAFEVLFVESTAAKLLLDAQYLLKISDFGAADFRYRAHVELQLNILEELPRVPLIEGPTFTFAHILIPHVPMVFEADGDIVTDPGFYAGDKASPIDRDYLVRGYTNQITFINNRMLEIAKQILDRSELPPVIVIQGDTGLEGQNRAQIFNAYHAPLATSELYPTITPVNSFRVLFNAYLGTEYELLPDEGYPRGDNFPVETETAAECVEG